MDEAEDVVQEAFMKAFIFLHQFRGNVNLYDLSSKTTYYYTVESVDSSGKSDGVTSPIKTFTTRQQSASP